MNALDYYIKQYAKMHARAKVFSGYSLKFHTDAIRDLIEATGSKTLLDYGCGKGWQYLGLRLHEKWGGILPYCYDPAVPGLSEKPIGQFDGVICTDVLEHIPTEHLKEIVSELFNYSRMFLFACISTIPANKALPDGTNCHISLLSETAWEAMFKEISKGRHYRLVFRD